ncbi:MAG: FtsX-like permease family protein, partial [Oscillospiraceae bacterium]|nr:FtsX-like permease family protein [Oscillospiraceae bacterium]
QVIEKNFQSIAMCKILGFQNGEIGMLYILSTSIAVIIGLILAVPVADSILRWAFNSYLYKVVSGYFPYNVRSSTFMFMIALGIVSYCVVAVLQLLKIRKIQKGEALKNVE